MSATIRRTARSLVLLAAVPAALALGALPATAVPIPGDPVPEPPVVWGWPDGEGPDYPGQRGASLPPQFRGPVLEFLDR